LEQYIRNDLFSYLILFGIIQGIILGIILLNNKGKNKTANRLLGLIVIGILISNLDFWGGYTRYTLQFPHLLDISWSVGFLFGPLILVYFKFYLRGKLIRKDFLYFIPFIFLFFYSFAFILQDGAYKFNVFAQSRGIELPLKEFNQQFNSNPLGIRTTGNKILIPYFIVFIILAAYELIRSIRKNKIQLSFQNKLLIWLISFLSIIVLDFSIFISLQIKYPSADNEYIFAIMFTLITYFITWHLLTRSNFFEQSLLNKKYEKSALNKIMKDQLHKKILDAFEIQKLFLDNLFSLKTLSKSISTSPNYVSQVINERFELNIYELTAKYRIEEAEMLLKDKKKNRTIEDIAHSVGYNSKSAFNKALKGRTGKTPSEYRNVLP